MTLGNYRVGDHVIDPAFLPYEVAGTITHLANGMVRVYWHTDGYTEWLAVNQLQPKEKV
jgi:hypothetical protein